MTFRRVWGRIRLGLCAGALALAGPAYAEPLAADPSTAETVAITYLGKAYKEPPPLSLLKKILTDEGVAGAELGVHANNTTGVFLGQNFVLKTAIVPEDGDPVAKAREVLKGGDALIIADLQPQDLLAVSDLPEAAGSVILNVRSYENALREQDCRHNVFHILPSNAMRADALAQYLVGSDGTAGFWSRERQRRTRRMPKRSSGRRGGLAGRSSRSAPSPSMPAIAGPIPATSRSRPRCRS